MITAVVQRIHVTTEVIVLFTEQKRIVFCPWTVQGVGIVIFPAIKSGIYAQRVWDVYWTLTAGLGMIPVSVSVVKLGGLWQGIRVQVIRWGQGKGQGRWGHFNRSIMGMVVKNNESITMEKIQNRKDGQNGKTANSKERGRKRENGKMLVSF